MTFFVSICKAEKPERSYVIAKNEQKKLIRNKDVSSSVVYDTSGQERFRALSKIYYHSTDVVFLLYDITYRKSFDDLGEWLKEIKEKLSYCMIGHYIIFLLGNKIDMIDIENKKRETTEEAENFCEEKGI